MPSQMENSFFFFDNRFMDGLFFYYVLLCECRYVAKNETQYFKYDIRLLFWHALFNIFVIANIIRHVFHNTWNEFGICTSMKDSMRTAYVCV